MKVQFGKTLIEKRFGTSSTKRRTDKDKKVEKKLNKEKKLELSKNKTKVVNKSSITEYTGADKLEELLCINMKNICNTKQEHVFNTPCIQNTTNTISYEEKTDSNTTTCDNANIYKSACYNTNMSGSTDMRNGAHDHTSDSSVHTSPTTTRVGISLPRDNMFASIISNLDMTLSIPPRVPYDGLSKDKYKELEMRVFNEWKRINYTYVFERNIEIWRQFWITCERSDAIVQIIDARNPNFFVNLDIIKMYPKKKHVILANKSDLTHTRVVYDNCDVISYSATTDISVVVSYLNKLECKNIGFIGYPNVGKSSTINAILNKKKVKVSQTPGKTKYIQTLEYSENKTLLDCPGLTFPKHTKASLLLNGVLNADKVVDLKSSLYEVITFIGVPKLTQYYKLSACNARNETQLIENMALQKNHSVSDCIKIIIKDLFCGNIQYDKIKEQYKDNINYVWK